MKNKGTLIGWDLALLTGIILILTVKQNDQDHNYLIIGFLTALVFSNCVRNHIAAYKLTGKIY